MELELQQDFKELFKLLNENKVRYLLIGGYAVVVHGYVRNTNDIDIVVSDDRENAQKVVDALSEFGFASSELQAELFTQKDSVVRMGVEPVKIEILNYLKGLHFDDAYERRKTIKVENIDINVVNLEDLLKNKRAVGRLKDLADVEELEKRN
jgi:predicted nucleotidyltransferase